jgi:hypothetical protein
MLTPGAQKRRGSPLVALGRMTGVPGKNALRTHDLSRSGQRMDAPMRIDRKMDALRTTGHKKDDRTLHGQMLAWQGMDDRVKSVPVPGAHCVPDPMMAAVPAGHVATSSPLQPLPACSFFRWPEAGYIPGYETRF